jgi:N-acetylmuramate 1-kinase
MEQHVKYKDFLVETIGDAASMTRLAGDASTREYYRVTHREQSYIVCADHHFEGTAAATYPFLIVYNLFRKHHVPVPEVDAFDSSKGLLLLQDAGDLHIEDIWPYQSNEALREHYIHLIDPLITMQSIKGDPRNLPFSLSFDVAKLMYEFDFFITHALKRYFRVSLSPEEEADLRTMLHALVEALYVPEYFVLTHRDYHSRNILYHDHQYYVIDFQDARMGLPQYDLVSLLQDSYVQLPTDIREELIDYYYEQSLEYGVHAMGRERFAYYYDLMAFQRNVKALGTFCYHVAVKKNRLYEKYIAPTLRYLPWYARRQQVLMPLYEKISGLIGRSL